MDAIQNILTRTSVRRFEDRPIAKETIHTILEAGMSGPSCKNARDWQFIVIQDRQTLEQMAQINSPTAGALKHAALGILVLGDLEQAFASEPDYWIIDASIAAQNMLLAAHALGVGAVWLGTWPRKSRVEGLQKLFNLPDSIIPHSLLALGYPAEQPKRRGFYEEGKVHFDKW